MFYPVLYPLECFDKHTVTGEGGAEQDDASGRSVPLLVERTTKDRTCDVSSATVVRTIQSIQLAFVASVLMPRSASAMNEDNVADSPRYHEKQRRQMCLLHTLNNMFQREEFTKANLDDICLAMDGSQWFNAHRSMLGLGNYDANVLMAALESRDLCLTFFDSRLSLDCINDEVVLAYIFNVPSDSYIPFFRGRHWFSVIKINGSFFNLDSKLTSPVRIKDFPEFARRHLAKKDSMLIVTRKEDAKNCIARAGIGS
uniref:ubiquitinyl hydrolase 1 n=1 Tax=Steinernema glaseri TaxID=37863 RepID=A0A1I8A0P1_9BILA